MTVPSEALTGRLDWRAGIGATALACIFVVAARLLWRFGLRHYSGALRNGDSYRAQPHIQR